MPTAMPAGAVEQQVGQRAGRTSGSCSLCVVVGAEVDRVLVDVGQQLFGDAGSGGPRCSAWPPAQSPSTRAEVALAVDQRVAQREVLRHAHQRVVDGGSPCGWYLPSTSPTDAGALLVLARVERRPSSFIAYRMRRCTGFRPSRTSGRARPTITLTAYSRYGVRIWSSMRTLLDGADAGGARLRLQPYPSIVSHRAYILSAADASRPSIEVKDLLERGHGRVPAAPSSDRSRGPCPAAGIHLTPGHPPPRPLEVQRLQVADEQPVRAQESE